MKIRALLRSTAILLACAMLFTMAPAKALATGGEAADNVRLWTEQEQAAAESTDSKAVVEQELVALRDRNTKHYAMSDGTVVAAVYGEPVHFAQDGQYLEIDNRLMEQTLQDGTVVYRNMANSYSVQFQQDAGNNRMMEFTEGDYKILWSLQQGPNPAADVSVRASAAVETVQTAGMAVAARSPAGAPSAGRTSVSATTVIETPESENAFAVERGRSALTYEDVLTGVDLEYLPTGNGVKENIIVGQPADTYAYIFLLELEGLEARLTEENTIELADAQTKELQYVMPAPYMLDADGAQSLEVFYTLQPYAAAKTAWAREQAVQERLPDSSDGQINLTGAETESSMEVSSQEENAVSADVARQLEANTADAPGEEREEDVPLENDALPLPGAEPGDSVPEDQRDGEALPAPSEEQHSAPDVEAHEDTGLPTDADADALSEPDEAVVSEAQIAQWTAAGENKYFLTITADADWMNESGRAFPVVIDPVVEQVRFDTTWTTGLGEGVFCHLITHGPVAVPSFRMKDVRRGENFGVGSEVNKNEYFHYQPYFLFDLPDLPIDAVITNATFHLIGRPTETGTVTADYVTDEWTMDSLETSVESPGTSFTVDYVKAVGTDRSDKALDMNLTKAMRRWFNDPLSNHGITLTYDGGTYVDIRLRGTGMDLTGVLTPYLSVSYRSGTGLEAYWSTHSQAVGRAGTGAVHDYNGQLTVVHEDVATAGERMPLAVQHVYNSSQQGDAPDGETLAGNGWRLNYAQTLRVPIGEADTLNYPYVYTDADGTKHYFKKQNVTYYVNGAAQNETATSTSLPPSAADEDGLGLYVVPVRDTALKATYPLKIVNKSGSLSMYFDRMGRLGMVSDSNQKENGTNASAKQPNKVTISYENVGGQGSYSLYNSIIADMQSLLRWNTWPMPSDSPQPLVDSCIAKLEELMQSDPYIRANYLAFLDVREAWLRFKGMEVNGGYIDGGYYANQALPKMRAALSKLGNVNTIAYQRIKTIQDAVNTAVTLTYNADGRIASMNDPAHSNGNISYTYDADGFLVSITYPNAEVSTYTYDARGHLLTAQEPDGYKVGYAWTGNRVTNVTEYAGNTTGQAYLIEYGVDATTTFRFSGPDDLLGNDDDICNVYSFDDTGKTVAVYTHAAGSDELFGAAMYEYDTSGTASQNKMKESGVVGGQTNNLLLNHSFEYADHWTAYGDCAAAGCHTNTLSASNGRKFLGAKAAYLSATQSGHTGVSGFSQTVTLPAGEYTFSAYASVQDAANGAYLVAKTADWSKQSDIMSGSTDTTMDGGFTRLSVTFTLTAETAVTLCAERGAGAGEAWFDAAQLETGPVANHYNILEDAGFELSETPYKWMSTSGTAQRKAGSAHTGGFCYELDGTVSSLKGLYCQPGLSGTCSYIFSGWYNADNAAPPRSDRFIGVKVTDGSGFSKQYVFNTYSEGWQFFSVTLPQRAWTTAMKIEVLYNLTEGSLLLDDFQLLRTDTVANTYSSTGQLLNTTTGTMESKRTYDSRDHMKTVETPSGNKTTYTYDSVTNDLTKAAQSTGPDTSYTYDKYGNVKAQMVREGTSGPAYNTQTTYTADGNFVATTVNTRGKSTSYSYNSANGLLQTTTDPKNVVTTYTYNADDQLSTVSAGGVTNTYGYDEQKRLSGIEHNGISYGFAYDVWGNTVSTSVAGETLVEHAYEARNGRLTETTYANGFRVEPMYNEREQVIGSKRNGTVVEEILYNNMGQVVKYVDFANDLCYTYDYDTMGRVLREQRTEQASGNKVAELRYQYDSQGRLTRLVYDDGTGAQSYGYTFRNDDLLLTTTLPGGGTASNTYDALSRLTGVAVKPFASSAAGRVLHTALTYTAGAGTGGTTGLVASYQTKIGSTVSESYSYAYDDAGNIVSARTKDNQSCTYEYDALGRLTRVNDEAAGVTTTYAYDGGGNLTSAQRYAYTTGAISGTAESSDAYEYASTGWKDQLVSFNGQPITYDSVGNPLTYLDKTITWQNGRELATVTAGERAIAYGYNLDGIRTEKTVDDVTTTYTLDGTTVLSEQTGDEALRYYYANGLLTRIGYQNGESAERSYLIGRNAQGDVTALYSVGENAATTLVGTYTYDAWGKLIAATKAAETSDPDGMLERNPFRYRGYYWDRETGFYYLNSRYYDPEVRRFINADTMLNPQTGLMGQNLYAYCNNDPVAFADPNGQFLAPAIRETKTAPYLGPKEELAKAVGFDSVNQAAMAFGIASYNASGYTRTEMASEIYSKSIGGETRYFYTTPRLGSPHGVEVSKANVPQNSEYVAFAHTHLVGNDFSKQDKKLAADLQCNAYVIGPALEVKKYVYTSEKTITLLAIEPISLTESRKASLVEQTRDGWFSHLPCDSDPNLECSLKTWPNNLYS